MCMIYLIVKPIFHQNAKYLASGTFASPKAKKKYKDTNMLVYFALGDANFSRFYLTRNLKVASGI